MNAAREDIPQGIDRRQAVRAILMTPGREVLLMQFVDRASGRRVWMTPGGGKLPGEDSLTCLRREVFEETGLADFEVGPCLWLREHLYDWGGRQVFQVEEIFLIETERFTPADEHLGAQERDELLEVRWWRRDEIASSPGCFAPRALADYLRQLEEQGPPSTPLMIGI